MPRHKPFGLLHPLPVPTGAWSSLSMDFIVKLPPTPQGLDSILVFVDRFTKMAHFIAYTEEGFDAPELAEVFLRNIVRLHGLPKDIVSDRGSVFTSKFWGAFLNLLHVQPNFSTSFHPQSDGQTERVNQVLEQYLRIFTSYQQDDWPDHLTLAEVAYNNTKHTSTGISPFYANYGYHPAQPSDIVLPDASQNPEAHDTVSHLQEIHEQLTESLLAAQEDYSRFYNKKVLKSPQYQEGDLVWLLRRHIKTTRPSDKLDFKRLGPYKIVKEINPMAFKINLPASSRLHPVFHVSLLEPVSTSNIPGRIQDPPPPVEFEGELEYTIKQILDSRFSHGRAEYLVDWEGYSAAERTWEPLENVENTAPFGWFTDRYPDKANPRPTSQRHQSRRSSP